jgi:membrane protein implicated in regulation of membrane protease activity
MYDILQYLNQYLSYFWYGMIILAMDGIAFIIFALIFKGKWKLMKATGFFMVIAVLGIFIIGYMFLPNYLRIKKDINSGSIIIGDCGTLESFGGNQNRIKIEGNYYYIYDFYFPLRDDENIGKEVNFSYYQYSKCIYSIELSESN